jgi:molecular chaperone GrpE
LNHAVKSEGQGTAQEFESLREGIDLTWRQFLQLLEKFGVTRIEALGKPFDPNFHQAMGMLEDPDSPPNTVVEEHQPGYSLKDRLLRPCMVVVSCSPEGAPVEDNKSGPEESSGDEEDQKMQEDS